MKRKSHIKVIKRNGFSIFINSKNAICKPIKNYTKWGLGLVAIKAGIVKAMENCNWYIIDLAIKPITNAEK